MERKREDRSPQTKPHEPKLTVCECTMNMYPDRTNRDTGSSTRNTCTQYSLILSPNELSLLRNIRAACVSERDRKSIRHVCERANFDGFCRYMRDACGRSETHREKSNIVEAALVGKQFHNRVTSHTSNTPNSHIVHIYLQCKDNQPYFTSTKTVSHK